MLELGLAAPEGPGSRRRGQKEAARAGKVNLAQLTHQSGAAVARGACAALFSPLSRLISGYSAAL